MKKFFVRLQTAKKDLIVRAITEARHKREAKLWIVILTGGPFLFVAMFVNWLCVVYTNFAVTTLLNIVMGVIFIKFVFDLETLELISKEIEKKQD